MLSCLASTLPQARLSSAESARTVSAEVGEESPSRVAPKTLRTASSASAGIAEAAMVALLPPLLLPSPEAIDHSQA